MTTARNDEFPTLLELAKSVGEDGMPLRVVEHLSKRKALANVLPWREGNLSTGHRLARRKALPTPIWKKINQGIPADKATQDQLDETCGMLALKSTIDEDLVELNGGAAYRMKQEMAFGEALWNAFETALFYESTKDHPERIMGLAPRHDLLSGNWGAQVINSQISSSGADQSSIWFLKPGLDTVYCIVPKGTKTGIQYKDMGLDDVLDEDGNGFPAYKGVWKWRCGLAVEDRRYVVRLANIDTSAIAKTGSLLIEDMVDAAHQLEEMEGAIIIANRTIGKYLHHQALNKSFGGTFQMTEPGGRKIPSFLGMPIYISDALLNTEDIVA